MATASHRDQTHPDVRKLENIPFERYVRFVGRPASRHLRMAYFDGTLEIMSPRVLGHERPSVRLRWIVTTVANVLGIPHEGVGQGTFRRAGDGPLKGTGREADQSFYLQSIDRLPLDREPDLDAGDPPPDLWIEVDNRASSQARLPTYARLGIPEVWQYRAETGKIRFLRLEGTAYTPIDQSLALPVLTPPLVEEALRHGSGLIESVWVDWLHQWAEQFRPA